MIKKPSAAVSWPLPLAVLISMVLAPALLAQRPSSGTHLQGCWKTAGVTPSEWQRIWPMVQNAHQRIREACSDSSLSEEQKLAKIREIRESSHAEVYPYLSPEHREALEQCQEGRHPGNGQGHREKPQQDPCGHIEHR